MITIVSKDNCPYCVMAKNLIKDLWFDYIEIDVWDDYTKLLEIVAETQMRTVPQIFSWEAKKQNLLWWYSDIKKLYDEWKLIEKLQENK